jgi:hypothetical protein
MDKKKIGWRAAPALVVVLVAGQAAAASIALKDVKEGPNEDQVKVATVKCDVGKLVVGGGASILDKAGLGSRGALLTQMLPFQEDGPRGGYLVVAEIAPEEHSEWELFAYALCAPKEQLPDYEVVNNFIVVDKDTSFAHAAARCPEGKQVIGTGASILNSGNQVGLQLSRSSKPRDISRSTAGERKGDYTAAWVLGSYAICTKPMFDTMIITPDPKTDEPPTLTAFCPSGMAVHSIGGGGPLRDSGPSFLKALRPTTVAIPPNRGTVHMSELSPDGLAAQVICGEPG